MIDHSRHILITVYETYLGRAVFRISFLICFMKAIGLNVHLVQMQWSVKRYEWTFSAAIYVNTYAALVCTCVLAGLPHLSSYLLTTLGSAQKREIRILRLSLLFRTIGMLAMGFSLRPNAFGIGLPFWKSALGALVMIQGLSGYTAPIQEVDDSDSRSDDN